MTTELKVGRELDALIAEKVMGLVRCKNWRHADGTFPSERCFASPDSPTQGAEARLYSTEIADAWLVVEKIVASHMKTGLTDRPDGKWGFWICRDMGQPEEETYFCTGDTPAEAICLAAMKAVCPSPTYHGEKTK